MDNIQTLVAPDFLGFEIHSDKEHLTLCFAPTTSGLKLTDEQKEFLEFYLNFSEPYTSWKDVEVLRFAPGGEAEQSTFEYDCTPHFVAPWILLFSYVAKHYESNKGLMIPYTFGMFSGSVEASILKTIKPTGDGIELAHLSRIFIKAFDGPGDSLGSLLADYGLRQPDLPGSKSGGDAC
uniref:Uncharacterized protein n=1 Tax=viral metagenome TaxID=1070528 RepID=A0A2V0R904_9ZZZZ